MKFRIDFFPSFLCGRHLREIYKQKYCYTKPYWSIITLSPSGKHVNNLGAKRQTVHTGIDLQMQLFSENCSIFVYLFPNYSDSAVERHEKLSVTRCSTFKTLCMTQQCSGTEIVPKHAVQLSGMVFVPAQNVSGL